MTTIMWLWIGLGLFLGFFAGRWSAETGSARHTMTRVWRGRKDYRK